MTQHWPDLTGVTASGGQARLPAHPDVVVATFAEAFRSEANGGITLDALVEAVQASTRGNPQRIAGLAGWLPLSRVASWDPSNGHLSLHPSTHLEDLALRYAAWVNAQPLPDEERDRRTEYVAAIGDGARRAGVDLPPRKPRPMPEVRKASGEEVPEPLIDPELSGRIARLVSGLDQSFLERRTHVRAALLALLSGQHLLLLGPPGTAKSMLARALCDVFADARYFEYLLSRFTHPDELFGPVSIPGLKEEDYRRITEGFLPQAHVAFLDEIFKANSAILNSLLTLINERLFHHGRHRDAVPLIGLVGASNELPDPDGGLAALYDRFLVRLSVPPLGGAEAFLQVATGSVPGVTIDEGDKLTDEDLTALREAAQRVVVPPMVQETLLVLWRHANREDWQVSDRRWRQAIGMLRVAAAASGRREVDLLDLLLLQPVLAPTPNRIPEVRDAILEQLGTGAVPQHDLRAQWLLLRQDRVAPVAGQPDPKGPGENTWRDRMRRRRASVDRFLALHTEAVQQLASDRQRMEAAAASHPWVDSLPVQVLSAHIEAARDLADILRVAEGYHRALASPAAVAAALVNSLPERSRRVYGHDLACSIDLAGSGLRVGLTLAGERVPLEGFKGRKSPGDMTGEAVVVRIEPGTMLDWVGGARETDDLLASVPAWAARNARTALESARRLIGGQVVPSPPELS